MRQYVKKFVGSSLLVLALGAGAACGRDDNQQTGDARPGDADRRMSDSRAGDPNAGMAKSSGSDLENQIKVKLQTDDQLKISNLDVSVDADKNEVTISGTVQSEAERTKAVELAKSAQPGVTVNDKIDVKPREAT